MKIQTWLNSATSQLTKTGIESARLDATILLEKTLSKPREWLLAHCDQELTQTQFTSLNKSIFQRAKRIPLAYIIGSKEFYEHTFFVNPDVLIPRPESEAMIELLKSIAVKKVINTVIDIGTGSGCLAITAKLLYPDMHVIAVDNSRLALTVAKKNALRHNTQIQFRETDIYEGIPSMPKTRPYIILANLPYVSSGLITSDEITKEPATALFSGKDGLEHYREFWNQVAKLKNKPIAVITECLESQHVLVVSMASKAGYRLQKIQILAQIFVTK